MIIIYDIDALKDNYTIATICRNFKKVMEGIEINTEDPSFVLTIVRRSRDNNKLAIDSTSHCVFNKFDERMLSYAGIDIYKIPVIRLFTERLAANESCPSMEVRFPDNRVSFEFNNGYIIWDKTKGDVVFDTRQYVLLSTVEMDQGFNKINDGKMTIIYDITSIEAEYVSTIEHKNFYNLLEKAGIDGSEIKHVTFKRIGYNRKTSPVIDNMYEALEGLMLYNLGIDIDVVDIVSEAEQKSHKNIPVIQVRFHGKQLVYDFDTTTFDWVKRDEIPIIEKGSNKKSKNITPMTNDHLYHTHSMYKPMIDNVISIVKKVRSSVSYNGKILILVPPPINTVNVTLETMKRDPDFNNLKIISINGILSLPDKEMKLSGSDIIVSTLRSLTGVRIPDLSVILNFDKTNGKSPSVLEQLMFYLRRDNRETYYFDTSYSIDNISDHSPDVLIEKQPLLWTTQKMVYPQYMNTPIPTHNYRGFGYNINDVQSGRFILLKPFEVSLENFSHVPIILDSKQVAHINPVSCRIQRFNEQSTDDVGLYIRLLPTSPVILIQGEVVKLGTMELIERLIDTIIERNNIDVKIYDATVPSHNLNVDKNGGTEKITNQEDVMLAEDNFIENPVHTDPGKEFTIAFDELKDSLLNTTLAEPPKVVLDRVYNNTRYIISTHLTLTRTYKYLVLSVEVPDELCVPIKTSLKGSIKGLRINTYSDSYRGQVYIAPSKPNHTLLCFEYKSDCYTYDNNNKVQLDESLLMIYLMKAMSIIHSVFENIEYVRKNRQSDYVMQLMDEDNVFFSKDVINNIKSMTRLFNVIDNAKKSMIQYGGKIQAEHKFINGLRYIVTLNCVGFVPSMMYRTCFVEIPDYIEFDYIKNELLPKYEIIYTSDNDDFEQWISKEDLDIINERPPKKGNRWIGFNCIDKENKQLELPLEFCINECKLILQQIKFDRDITRYEKETQRKKK